MLVCDFADYETFHFLFGESCSPVVIVSKLDSHSPLILNTPCHISPTLLTSFPCERVGREIRLPPRLRSSELAVQVTGGRNDTGGGRPPDHPPNLSPTTLSYSYYFATATLLCASSVCCRFFRFINGWYPEAQGMDHGG